MLSKLTYTLDGVDYASADPAKFADQAVLSGAVKAIAMAVGVAETSVAYLLQNGWSQSIQDSFAGPRAQAIKDKEEPETVQAVVVAAIQKRVKAIVEGTVKARAGRDPVRSVGLDMLEKYAKTEGFSLPKDKDELSALLDAYIDQHREKISKEIDKRRVEKAKLDAKPILSLEAMLKAAKK